MKTRENDCKDEPSAISFSVCHAITISSELASCHGFLVCLKVEIDEKTKVNREQEAAKHSRVFCTSATSYVREGIWEIFSSGMFVGCYQQVNE